MDFKKKRSQMPIVILSKTLRITIVTKVERFRLTEVSLLVLRAQRNLSY